MQHSKLYIILFSAAVCLVCSVVVAGSAVSLKELQDTNKLLDRKTKVLTVAGLIEDGQKVNAATIDGLFKENVTSKVVSLDKGTYVEMSDVELASFDQKKRSKDSSLGMVAPKNPAGIQRISKEAMVYLIGTGGKVDKVILPIKGKGLWSTLYGFIALKPDIKTIAGITFYEHGETPGLGGEVDNPSWKAKWPGKRAFDDNWAPKIMVVKGQAKDEYGVDGLSGATITSRGVGNLLQFWLGVNGFGNYLKNFREGRG